MAVVLAGLSIQTLLSKATWPEKTTPAQYVYQSSISSIVALKTIVTISHSSVRPIKITAAMVAIRAKPGGSSRSRVSCSTPIILTPPDQPAEKLGALMMLRKLSERSLDGAESETALMMSRPS